MSEQSPTTSQLIQSLPAVVYVRELGASRRCSFVNARLMSLLGYRPEEWLADEQFWITRIHPQDVTAFMLDEQEAQSTGSFHSDYRFVTAEGATVWLRDQASVRTLEDGRRELQGMVYEVTEPRRLQESIRANEERFRSLTDSAPAMFWGAAATGEFTYFNRRWIEFTGRMLDEELHNGWLQYVHPDDRGNISAAMDNGLKTRTEIRLEFRMMRHDGAFRWLLCTGVPQFSGSGTFLGYLGACIDISDRKLAEQRLVHDALHDALTGLPNRSLFVDRLGRALARTRRNREYRFAVLFLDLDRFKVINDSLGHVMGDEMLVALTKRLSECLRPADTVSRFGGDEFAILLEDIASTESADVVANRIHDLLKKPFTIGNHEVFTTASIGIAIGSDSYKNPDDLLRDADTAMHRTKAHSPGSHQLFENEMHARAVKMLVLDTDLRRAVERGDFTLAYQPIISLRTGRVMRFEALVRWKHPERGWISPGDFIPVAEDTGLILPIGSFVLDESMRQLAAWREQFPQFPWLAMNVNLSGKQFAQAELLQHIDQCLQSHSIRPQHLSLEITETCLMDNPDAARAVLHRLRDLGVSVAMDDFGTGYSSLGYLHNFPLDGLKIDRSFVSGPDRSRGGRIVHTIITMAHDLGLPCTAEGIETIDQARWIASLGCEFAQGYLFAKPLSPTDVEKMLIDRPVVSQIEEVLALGETVIAG